MADDATPDEGEVRKSTTEVDAAKADETEMSATTELDQGGDGGVGQICPGASTGPAGPLRARADRVPGRAALPLSGPCSRRHAHRRAPEQYRAGAWSESQSAQRYRGLRLFARESVGFS